ncbi:MAG: glycosyltransferase [Chloroflexi bacterium]|nr:MAG: glycosyltransferase [Chloroflexota bacterium]
MCEEKSAASLQASVIIPAYNAADTLPRCLEALKRQSLPVSAYEVIVVDDGSTDDTVAVAEAYGATVVRARHEGPASARNMGVGRARAPVVVFTDADCEPAPDFLERMLESLRDPRVSGARGAYRSRQSGLVARFVQLEYEERYRHIVRYEKEHGTVDALDTSYAAYRRQAFLEAGGFDTRFGSAAGEDHELSFRMARQGHVFRFVPEAVVYHQHVSTWWGYARRKYRIGYWKAFLTRQHPRYVLGDAHTTQSLKLQMALTALSGPAILAWLAGILSGWVVLAPVLLFLLSAIPFLRLIARRDPPVLPVALPLLLTRATASGLGFFVGLLNARREASLQKSRMQIGDTGG